MDKILEVVQVTKQFPGVKALDRFSFSLRRGEVHALVGENGAGKSTLIHILGGVLRPDEGEIVLEGQEMRFHSAHDAALNGISVVYQDLSLVPNLSVAENIFANRQPTGRLGFMDRKALNSTAEQLLREFGEEISPSLPVRHVPLGKAQVVEIVKAMSLKPKVLLMDEPTSSLSTGEVQRLFANLQKWKNEGISILYVSHNLSEVFEVADRVTVMKDGQYVDTMPASETTEDELVSKMVGRTIQNIYEERLQPPQERVRFSVEGFSRGSDFQDVTFQIREGEIVGLAGLVGAGRTELGRAIFGAEPPDSGELRVNGKLCRVRSPCQAIQEGIAYLTEDRKIHGLCLSLAIRDNLVSPNLRQFVKAAGLLSDRRIRCFAEECRERFRIVTPSVSQRVMNLSGGNQQKVLLSMWLGIRPKVLIADEPTRGVDVGTKSEIYHHLRRMAEQGTAILLISSDLQEILNMSDRVLVMREGQIVSEIPRKDATEELVLTCAIGAGCPRGTGD
jgi:ABC-type sugar transport system ATPase subunit